MITKPIHKTNILPLRWFANFCDLIGSPSLQYLFDFQDEGITSGIKWSYHHFMWKWTSAVHGKWGTSYEVLGWDLEENIDKDEY